MIIITGDLFLGNSLLRLEEKVRKEFEPANYIVSNFENVFEREDQEKRKDKSAILLFKKENLDNYLEQINSRIIFTLGNNHIHDLGVKGILSTKELLSNYKNISLAGVGTYDEVIKPLVFEDNEKKIALLPVSTDEPEVNAILAESDFEGVLDYNDCNIPGIIKESKKEVDFFIITPHWGKEYIDYPAVQLRKKAHKWIDAGADLIVGHHPHIMKGKEKYKGKWIYYSLGNYIFPELFTKNGIKISWNKENNRSVFLKIDFLDEINIEEFGLNFNNKTLTLKLDDKSLNIFYQKSEILDLETVPIKKYYGYWQKNYYDTLNKKYFFLNKLKNKIFLQHKDYGIVRYQIYKILKKIGISKGIRE